MPFRLGGYISSAYIFAIEKREYITTNTILTGKNENVGIVNYNRILYIAMSAPYLLLIDSRVLDISDITGSLLPGVDHLVFNYEVDTYESLKAKITKSYDCVGVTQHNQYSRVYSFLKSEDDMGLSCVVPGSEPDSWVERSLEEMDSTLASWSAFIDFLTWLKTERGMVNYDLLACNLLEDANWVYAINTIKTAHNIHVRASLNITGEGGDFILESDSVDLIGVCFSQEILNYKHSFESFTAPTIMFDGSGKIWMCGHNGSGQMGTGDTTAQITLITVDPQPTKTVQYVRSTSFTSYITYTDNTSYAAGGQYLFSSTNSSTTSNTFVNMTNFYTQVPGKTIKKVEGVYNVHILTTDGNLYSAGQNQQGVFGNALVANYANGVNNKLYRLENTTGKTVVDFHMSTGQTALLLLMNDGTIYGTGDYNNFGMGTTGYSMSMFSITVPGNETVKQITGAENQCAILTASNKVYLAGNNGAYQYCNNSNVRNNNWNLIPLPNGKTPAGIAVGGECLIVLFTDGTLYGAGDNSFGQLGLGTAVRAGTTSMAKITIPSNKFVSHAQLYGGYIVVLTSDGYVYAAGANSGNGASGMLGTNDNTTYKTLTQMLKNVGGTISNMTSISRLNAAYDPIYQQPDAPTITGITSSNNQLSVAFTAPSRSGAANITTYKYSINGGSDVNANTTASPIVITGLTNGTSYTITLKAVNSFGDSSASASSTATPYTVPDAPTLVSVTPANQQLTIVFTAPAFNGGTAITAYKYSVDGGATYVQVDAASFVSPYQVTGLTNGQSYQVKLRAVNPAGDSTDVSASPVIPYGVPLNVRITGITASSGSANVYVACDSIVSLTTYLYSLDGTNYTDALSSSLPVQISNLQNGTSYTVWAKAVNEAGTSAASQSVSFMPYVPQPGPDAPTITSVDIGDSQLTVNFTDGSNNGSPIVGYKYSTDGTNYIWASETSSPIVIKQLINNQSYPVTIKAVNSVESSASNSVTQTPRGAPGTPVILSTTTNEAVLSATFNIPSLNNNSASDILVQYRITTVSTGNYVDYDSVATNGVFSLSGIQLEHGVKYNFQIRALISDGTPSAWSTAVVVYPPPVPDLASYVEGDKSVSVTFSNVIDLSNVAGFKYKMDNESYQWMDYIPSPTYTFTGLTNRSYNNNPTKTYSLRFKAVNYKGEESAEVGPYVLAAYGPPDVPTVLSVEAGDCVITVRLRPGDAGGLGVPYYDYTFDNAATYNTFGDVFTSTLPDASGVVTIWFYPLTNRTTYTFSIRARQSPTLLSDWTPSYSATPAGRPEYPVIQGVTTSGSTALISVNQSFPNNPGNTYFNRPDLFMNGPGNLLAYQYSLDGGNTYSYMQNIVSPLKLYGLNVGNTYSVRLKLITTHYKESFPSTAYTFTVTSDPSNPDAPTISSATPGDESILLAIVPGNSNGSAITGYEYSLNGSSTFSPISASGDQITITGLTNGTPYTVTIRQVNAIGKSPLSVPSSVVTPYSVLSATQITRIDPENGGLHVYVSNSALASLLENNFTITGYKYALDGNTFDGEVTTSASDFVISGLTNGSTYTIAVKAITSAGITGKSNVVSDVAVYGVPSAPTIVSVTPQSRQALVYFTDGSANGSPVLGYKYRLNGGQIFCAITNTSPITIYGLTNAQSYTLELFAENDAGISLPSTASSPFMPYDAPLAPVITDILPGNGVAYVYFNDVVANGSDIIAMRYTIGGSALDVSGTTSPLTIPSLINKNVYQIGIYAVNGGGQSPVSNRKMVVVGSPSAPVITDIVPGPKKLMVSFTSPNENGSPITSYMWSPRGTTQLNKVAGTTSPLTITPLNNGFTYDVVIYAVNKFGTSKASNNIGIRVPFDIPVKPTITSVIPMFNSALLSFNTPFNNGSPIIKYQYALNAETTFTDLSGLTSPIVIPGMQNNVNYSVKMVAVNAAGASLVSSSSKPAMYKYLPPNQIKVTSVVPAFEKLTVNFTAPLANGANISTYKYSLNGNAYVDTQSTQIPIVITNGIQNNTNYNVSVMAVNSAGQSVPSAPLAKPVSFVWLPPLAPLITTVTTGNGSANVAFTPPVPRGPPITGYSYSLNGGVSNIDLSGQVTSPIVIEGLTNDVSYNVTIVAMTSAGYSARSAPKLFTPVYKAPAAPTIGTIIAQSGGLTVNFTAGLANGSPITTYKYTFDNGNTVVDAQVDKSPIVITGLQNRVYSVRLIATNALGDSVLSVAKPATPLP